MNVAAPIYPVARTHIHTLVKDYWWSTIPGACMASGRRWWTARSGMGAWGLGDSLSSIDVALWDPKGKANDEPLLTSLAVDERAPGTGLYEVPVEEADWPEE